MSSRLMPPRFRMFDRTPYAVLGRYVTCGRRVSALVDERAKYGINPRDQRQSAYRRGTSTQTGRMFRGRKPSVDDFGSRSGAPPVALTGIKTTWRKKPSAAATTSGERFHRSCR